MSNRSKAYREACEYFNLPKGWVLHHKDVTLKSLNPKRYKEWRPEDLVPMTKSEHMTLHNKLRGTSGAKGKKWTEERKQKFIKTRTGMHWKQSEEAVERRKGKPSNAKGKHFHWKLVDGKRIYYK